MERGSMQGTRMLLREAELPGTRTKAKVARDLEIGLESAWSIKDRTIPLFNRVGRTYAHSGTFTGTEFLEDMRELGGQDVAIVGVPLDTGTT
ncbi:MAG: agmatinase, partial [Thermomicrobiales bacterium]